MINKQSMWFVTLFSIILVLSIYYVTVSDNSIKELKDSIPASVSNEEGVKTIEAKELDNDVLVSLKIKSDEDVLMETESLQNILLDKDSSLEEKNDAYSSLKELNQTKGKEEQIEKLLKDEFDYESFVKIENEQIHITILSKDHSKEIANKIITKVQSLYDNMVYITVKFQN